MDNVISYETFISSFNSGGLVSPEYSIVLKRVQKCLSITKPTCMKLIMGDNKLHFYKHSKEERDFIVIDENNEPKYPKLNSNGEIEIDKGVRIVSMLGNLQLSQNNINDKTPQKNYGAYGRYPSSGYERNLDSEDDVFFKGTSIYTPKDYTVQREYRHRILPKDQKYETNVNYHNDLMDSLFEKEADEFTGEIKHLFTFETFQRELNYLYTVLDISNYQPDYLPVVNLVKEYLGRTNYHVNDKTNYHVNDRTLKLLILTSILIVSKNEDVICLNVDKLKKYYGNQFSSKEILNFEIELLKTVNFDLNTTNLYAFYKMFANEIYYESTIIRHLVLLLLIIVCNDLKIYKYKNSLIVASVIYIMRVLSGSLRCDDNFIRVTRYTKEDLVPCVTDIMEFFKSSVVSFSDFECVKDFNKNESYTIYINDVGAKIEELNRNNINIMNL